MKIGRISIYISRNATFVSILNNFITLILSCDAKCFIIGGLIANVKFPANETTALDTFCEMEYAAFAIGPKNRFSTMLIPCELHIPARAPKKDHEENDNRFA